MSTSETDIADLFMQHILNEDTAEMQRMMDTRIDVQNLFGDSTTAIHLALAHQKPVSFDFLVAAGLDVNGKGFLNISPLRLVLDANDLRSVQILLDAGAYPFAESAHDTRDGSRHITDLEYAERSHAPLDIGVAVRTASERYALVREASINRFANVEDFLQRDYCIDAQDDRGNSSLHYAAIYQNANVIGRLTSGRADVRTENKQGYTPLIACYMDCQGNMASLLDCFDALTKAGARVMAPTSKSASLYTILTNEGAKGEVILRHLRPQIDKELAEMSLAASTVQQKTKLMPRIQTIRKNPAP